MTSKKRNTTTSEGLGRGYLIFAANINDKHSPKGYRRRAEANPAYVRLLLVFDNLLLVLALLLDAGQTKLGDVLHVIVEIRT